MQIYNYHPLTGALLSVGVADPNPLDSSEPIVPGYATPGVPPVASPGWVAAFYAEDGTVPQNWPGGAWTLMRDYREVPLFRTEDGTVFQIGDEFWGVGNLPDGLTDLPRPSFAHVWSGAGWQLDEALVAAQALAGNRREKGTREARARSAMEPLQMAVDIDLATADEAARLLAWKRYFVLLSRVDLANPVWPEEPAA